jgi:hypothetical protein
MQVRNACSRLGAGVLILCAACTTTPPSVEPVPGAADPPATVLLLRGSAFDSSAVRDEARQLAATETRRPARVIVDDAAFERVVQPAASRLDRSVAQTARAEAKDARCRKRGRALATAVAEHADTILRVTLDATTTSRPATDADRKALGSTAGFSGVLSAVGLGDDTLYERKINGTVERTTFPGTTTTAKQRVRWRAQFLGKKNVAPPSGVREALAEALASMPRPAPTRWDPLARGLVSGGCPVLAIAVADTFLDDAAARRRIRAAAVGALGPKAQPAAQSSETAAVPDTSPTSTNESISEPAGESVVESTAPAPDPAQSCASLCTIHMVELCNNDRALWTQHGSRYENTRCGLRRSEAFLEDCYRMQWLSGTYEQSCVRPCQENADGRSRLLAVLRRSGCLRAGG